MSDYHDLEQQMLKEEKELEKNENYKLSSEYYLIKLFNPRDMFADLDFLKKAEFSNYNSIFFAINTFVNNATKDYYIKWMLVYIEHLLKILERSDIKKTMMHIKFPGYTEEHIYKFISLFEGCTRITELDIHFIADRYDKIDTFSVVLALKDMIRKTTIKKFSLPTFHGCYVTCSKREKYLFSPCDMLDEFRKMLDEAIDLPIELREIPIKSNTKSAAKSSASSSVFSIT